MHSHGSVAVAVLIMRCCAPRPKTDAARNVNSKHHFHSVTDGFFMDKDDDASEADLNPPPPLCNRKWSYLCLVSVIRHGLEIPTRASQVQYFCRQAVIQHNFRVVPRSLCNRLVLMLTWIWHRWLLSNRKWSYLFLISVFQYGLEIPTRISQVQYLCRQAVIRHNFRVLPRSLYNR